MVIADTSSLISLGETNNIHLITTIFGELRIASAVWNELESYNNPYFNKDWYKSLESLISEIKTENHLISIIDYAESESVILYQELQADYLLIDDQKAREIAETLNVNCVGSIGLLILAKRQGILKVIKPIFEQWIHHKRYFSKRLLNKILLENDEEIIV